MIDIDLSRVGATTILSCGTTNAGHYAFVQQGLSGNIVESAKKIYEYLTKYAPLTPDGKWKLYEIEVRDYKSWHSGEFYRVHVEYKFFKGREKYSNEIEISPQQAAEVYEMFREAATQSKDQEP